MGLSLQSSNDEQSSFTTEGTTVLIIVRLICWNGEFLRIVRLSGLVRTEGLFDPLEFFGAGRAEEPVVAYLGEAAWQHMLKESCDEVLLC